MKKDSTAMLRRTSPRSAGRLVRPGFTLVELLVVIAIIGVLVSLLLPAVQAAREAARRMNCQANLKNLALAVLNYESSKSALPQSSDANVVGANQNTVNLYTGSQLSWIVRILPYIEQQSLAQQFDLKKPFDTYKLETVATVPTPERAQPSILLCPSDSAQGRVYESPRYTGNRVFGKANYAAYASPEHIECQLVATGALINNPQPLKGIEDGQSNTLMLTEIRTREEPQDQRGAWAIAWPATTILGVDMHGTTSSTRICNQTGAPAYVPNAIWSTFALTPNLSVTSDPAAPRDDLRQCINSPEADIEGMPCWTRGDTTAAPRSLHAGGVIGANVDGSVRFVNDSIDAVLLGSIVCINDGLTLNQNP